MEIPKISSTGNNLLICICPEENSRPYDWMTFSTWYCAKKLLPDAAFVCFLPKKTNPKEMTFSWLDRCQIKKINTVDSTKNKEQRELLPNKKTLFIKPEALMIRHFYQEEIDSINSGVDLTGENGCEFSNDSDKVSFVPWLSGFKLSNNPVFLSTNGIIAGIDVKTWALQSREPIFLANWLAATLEEKVTQDAWRKMHGYYSMVV